MKDCSSGPVNEPLKWVRPDLVFYSGSDVLLIARQLIGMKLITCFDQRRTAGIITETEAYAGAEDRASHAFGGRRTTRTENMYRQGGLAYVYLCYGIHSLFNVVTNQPGVPHAVLIRAIYPVEGLSVMQERTGRISDPVKAGSGPGKVSKLLGINCSHNGTNLMNSRSLWMERSAFSFDESVIFVTKRIGIDYAGDDALLPYRFVADPVAAENELKKAGLA